MNAKLVLCFLILGVGTGCATALTTAGQKVVVINSPDVLTVSCQGQGNGHYENINEARNEVAINNGTHILITSIGVGNSVETTAFHCETTHALPVSRLVDLCNHDNGPACADLASKNRKKWTLKQRLPYYEKSCKLNFDLGCQAVQVTKTRIDIEKFKSECLSDSNAKSCIDAASLLSAANQRQDAFILYQRSCSLGNESGCDMVKNISEEQARQAQRQALQRQVDEQNMMLQDQADAEKRQRRRQAWSRALQGMAEGSQQIGQGMAQRYSGGNNTTPAPSYITPNAGYGGNANRQPASASNNCKGYAGPGGPCYDGPGGPQYAGPGGAAYSGPGGPKYDGPGGPEYAGPGGSAYSGPGGPRYSGPGGPSYSGPGGPANSDPGGPCYAGPGGPCYSGPGGTGVSCPAVCQQ